MKNMIIMFITLKQNNHTFSDNNLSKSLSLTFKQLEENQRHVNILSQTYD